MSEDVVDLNRPVTQSQANTVNLSDPIAKRFEVSQPKTARAVWQTLRAGLEGIERLDSDGREDLVRLMRHHQKFGMWGVPGNTAIEGLVQFCALLNHRHNDSIIARMADGLRHQRTTNY